MYISIRGALIRNLAAAIVNGAITLVLLLIAPLGLAGVITNTVMVTIATFVVCTGMDLIVLWLLNAASIRGDNYKFRDRSRDISSLKSDIERRTKPPEQDDY